MGMARQQQLAILRETRLKLFQLGQQAIISSGGGSALRVAETGRIALKFRQLPDLLLHCRPSGARDIG